MNTEKIFENITNYIVDAVKNNENLAILLDDEETNIVSDILKMALKISLAESLSKAQEDELQTIKSMLQDEDMDLMAIINRISAYAPNFESVLTKNVDDVIAEMSSAMSIEMDEVDPDHNIDAEKE